ncbi:M23 family metallopeptidase [Bordetella holmesii]|uniref:Peptidase, M23 family n=2 Tax=Bordetella holmesii TaxID=35814 RepID=A0A158M7U5_9BORD|nr:peptidoglycan DD-metalloendopeptidase family protein [Bordetella holmesii]AHV91644.1 peptidase M23 family protein [Bordetella holmesii ATCC 51541]AIT26690.1 peptidase M23 family protein [Bordetella holmesii 44057]EWM42204.1 peptidase M23 family protein [Bordetella holmesii 41130]EWM47275.1 peptidase M23 family protein [Bordetella holmesii 35009]EWM51433.1 peptidase M23 family protein [Bordetella holmesii 70147]
MNRGFNSLVRSLSRKVAALFTPAVETRSSRGGSLMRRTLVVCALGLFAGAAALGMVQQPDRTELPPLRLINSELPLLPEQLQVSASAPAPYISETRIRSGDTLASVLQRLDLDDSKLQTFLTHEASARSIYRLYPGRAVQAATDEEGKLVWLRYIHTPGNEVDGQVYTKLLNVQPAGDSFKTEEITESTDLQTRVAVGTIRSSLFAATDAAGIPDSITMQMADILGAKIDFLRDLRQGDQFRVVYEVRSHDGRYAGAGRLLAVEFVNNEKVYSAVWFSADNKSGSYYDFDGTSLRGAFLRTALKFSRISSTFGMRMHPIHRTWTGHKGVDYAAPSGTPIHSTADGTVEFAGWQNGYGNVVIVKHYGKYSTLYAHQSSIRAGLKKGDKIAQGDLLGYVGATGWATGPHLHYEFRIDNQPVDPLSVDLPVARKLEPAEARAFATTVAPFKQQIQLLTEFQHTLPESMTNVASR